MPTLSVPNKIAFYHRSVLVRHSYKYDDYPVDEVSSNYYFIGQTEFDIRDVAERLGKPLKSADTNVHFDLIVAALEADDGEFCRDMQVTLDGTNRLSDNEHKALVDQYNLHEQLRALSRANPSLEGHINAIALQLREKMRDTAHHTFTEQ